MSHPILAPLVALRAYLIERYRRLGHAYSIFRMRFLPSAVQTHVAKLTGVRGDGLWFSTGSTPHRAGIPKFGNHRDIFSISFFPAYMGLGVSARTLLAKAGNA